MLSVFDESEEQSLSRRASSQDHSPIPVSLLALRYLWEWKYAYLTPLRVALV